MQHSSNDAHPATTKIPGNKGKMVGPKPTLQTKHVWSIRTKLLPLELPNVGDRILYLILCIAGR
jgi:hypothetical protein